jgi:hypothetical protein
MQARTNPGYCARGWKGKSRYSVLVDESERRSTRVLRAKTAAVLRGRVEGRSERDGERQQTEERGDSREHAERMPMHHDVRGRQ